MPDFDVVVVGAGTAGLSALAQLDRAGCRVLCVEARDRIGGRILTMRDPLSPLPIELGAEFIHGRPPEIWQIIQSASLGVYDCLDASVHIRDGIVQGPDDAWEPVNHVMEDMRQTAASEDDQPFAAFLAKSFHPASAKELSASFVEGFNAAHKEIIGIASLAKDGKASDEIEGDRSFRFFGGYDAIPSHLLRQTADHGAKLRLNTALTEVEWRPGSVKLATVSALTGNAHSISARRAILTVPLGVLQAGSIRWRPSPERALHSASALAFGHVMRVVLRFREAFWQANPHFADVGFLLSNEALFPTWWTTLAVRAPILTGWSAGPHADALLGKSHAEIIGHALTSLQRVLGEASGRPADLLEAAYFHDWSTDPFARGAYSYVPVGALAAREALAEPIAETLYFAGEATELNGHSATVHGAIASGQRAAAQLIAAER